MNIERILLEYKKNGINFIEITTTKGEKFKIALNNSFLLNTISNFSPTIEIKDGYPYCIKTYDGELDDYLLYGCNISFAEEDVLKNIDNILKKHPNINKIDILEEILKCAKKENREIITKINSTVFLEKEDFLYIKNPLDTNFLKTKKEILLNKKHIYKIELLDNEVQRLIKEKELLNILENIDL